MTLSQPNETSTDAESDPLDPSRHEMAGPRFARLRSLHSAWGVLAPSVLSEDGLRIAEVGREMTDGLSAIERATGEVAEDELADFDRRLDEFEASIHAVAAEVPVRQLRSTLPARLGDDRQGLLDLLDVLIGPDVDDFESNTPHIGAIDYLTTLLCTCDESPGGIIRHDPVTLTQRLQTLCEHAEDAAGDRFVGVEAEFFVASNMDAEDLREEFQLRTLRSRKTELGIAFFVPRVLRAIVTYNAALISRAADEILNSGDWGFAKEEDFAKVAERPPATSVFDSTPLLQVIDAIRRRARDEPPETTAFDQIAWALDFEYLSKTEKKALLSDQLGTRDDPLGTAISVGLICRSLAVLSIELQTLGIPPDDLADLWTEELGELFQEQINTHIADNAYQTACSLSELKNKFLSAPLADQYREQKHAARPIGVRAKTPPPSRPEKEKPESARNLIQDALEESRGERADHIGPRIQWASWPWARILTGAALIALVLGVAGMSSTGSKGDLERWDRERLDSVSHHLVRGDRSEAGKGPAFVGTIDDAWLGLPAAERGASAEELVERLRDLGLQQIMIYDRDDTLRIQAIGSQPVRML